jgi:hypothetical protein
MDASGETPESGFFFNLAGRIRNVGLPATAPNSLVPLFEAVSNSIHAVESRWGEKSTTAGKITISIHRLDEKDEFRVAGFSISDNGVGLTDDNWLSFRTSDSPQKFTRGGKGVGRLSWLKAFTNCTIESRFLSDGGLMQRSFSFSLRSENPIQDYVLKMAAPDLAPGTDVHLIPFDPKFGAHCPKKTSTIAAKLVGHFLPYFMVDKVPQILVADDSEVTDLRQYYNENQARNSIETIKLVTDTLSGEQHFNVYHILLKKQLKFLENGLHWMFYAGNERVVREDSIDGQLGLKYVGDGNDCVYVGLVIGPFLDSHVNQERTSFTFTDETQADIHSAAVASARIFLVDFIKRIREHQVKVTDRVIRENPQFLPFRDILPEFVEKNLSLNTQGEEEIFVELSRRKLRLKRRLDGQIKSIREGGVSADIEAEVQNITKALNDEKKGSLAEYVVRRKAILDFLASSLAFKDGEARRYFREEVIHELIIPLGSDSDDLDYNHHNLWILDDRLAFYTFFKSDRPFRTFVVGSESGKEPDLAVIFHPALAFHREGRDEPIVIIEFKRPGRDDYDGNSNPVVQVLEYVDLFRKGSGVADKDGRILKPISPATRFICYVIADFTPTLLRVIRTTPANNPTPDGEGYFGTSVEHNAVIEVLPYAKVLNDARLRNEAFFRHLGLI